MNVSLTPQLEKIVRDKVESGLYSSASEVVREALRLMDRCEQEQLSERLRAALMLGIEEIERGDTVPFTRELFDQIVAEGRALAASGAPLDPDVAPLD